MQKLHTEDPFRRMTRPELDSKPKIVIAQPGRPSSMSSFRSDPVMKRHI